MGQVLPFRSRLDRGRSCPTCGALMPGLMTGDPVNPGIKLLLSNIENAKSIRIHALTLLIDCICGEKLCLEVELGDPSLTLPHMKDE